MDCFISPLPIYTHHHFYPDNSLFFAQGLVRVLRRTHMIFFSFFLCLNTLPPLAIPTSNGILPVATSQLSSHQHSSSHPHIWVRCTIQYNSHITSIANRHASFRSRARDAPSSLFDFLFSFAAAFFLVCTILTFSG